MTTPQADTTPVAEQSAGDGSFFAKALEGADALRHIDGTEPVEDDVFAPGVEEGEGDDVFADEDRRKDADELRAIYERLRADGLTDEDIETLHDLLQDGRESLDPFAGVPDLGIGRLEALIVDEVDETVVHYLPMARRRLTAKHGPIDLILAAARERPEGSGLCDDHPRIVFRPKLSNGDVRQVARVLGIRSNAGPLYGHVNRTQLLAARAIDAFEGDLSLYQGADGIAKELATWQGLSLQRRFALLDELPAEDMASLFETVRLGSQPTRAQRKN